MESIISHKNLNEGYSRVPTADITWRTADINCRYQLQISPGELQISPAELQIKPYL